MASGWTNRGKYNLLKTLQGTALPTNFAIAFSTDTPTEATDTMADVTEPAGYSRYSLNKDTTDWDTITAMAGGRGDARTSSMATAATYALLCDGTGGSSAEVWAFFDLEASRQVSDGQTLTLVDCELRFDKP